ncbi:DUF3027 domain-containing protein [Nocardioides daphniae]|uniref:DUF3027 domain-containing protein n=1 Tax=Nocardioides daphniae TaxID=402297 RepID=A0ABQ1QCD9_9ACTN|nr:DUF3027 domain-containing protein [Nocardioides daphniae]GGD22900.1 hypothetical protein GCM10007231_22470 [Nocardioides daphniae]
MNATTTVDPAVDPALVDAVDVARAALLEEVPADQVGEHLTSYVEQEGALTHVFASTHPGYVGWEWAVTIAGGDGRITVDEVVLLPGGSAIVAPPWVPYKERLQPGDLSPGDLLPVDDDDPRLVPTYLVGEETGEVDRAQIKGVAADLGLGRVRTLSVEGLDLAAQRWHDGDGGPEAPIAKSAPESCWSCGFLVRLSGSLSEMFGVCANGNANDDGRVVTYDHGCGAHSEVKLARKQQPAPVPEHAFDSFSVDLETF